MACQRILMRLRNRYWTALAATTILVTSCAYTPVTWTNCAPGDSCADPAILHLYGTSTAQVNSVVPVDLGEGTDDLVDSPTWVYDPDPNKPSASMLFLKPGRYKIDYSLHNEMGRAFRADVADLQAGHTYVLGTEACPALLTMFSPRCRWIHLDDQTLWIEDERTGQVIAGEKWCTVDGDCGAASSCTKSEGQSSGVCDIPGLRCTNEHPTNESPVNIGSCEAVH